jgi:hypothetical protein
MGAGSGGECVEAKAVASPSAVAAFQLAGHASLSTTQRYIEGSSDAKRRAVEML